MKTNNKTINHLFYDILDEDFGTRSDVVFTSSDDITSKQVKSALNKFDGFLDDFIISSELRFDRLITDEELETLLNRDKTGIRTYDFAEFQKTVKETVKNTKEQNETDEILN